MKILAPQQAFNPRPLAESVHGGIDYEELARWGLSAADVIDFSSNILPYGPAPSVIKAIRGVAISGYPDRDCLQLKRSIADNFNIAFETILVGNGCCELIHQIALGIIRTGDSILVVGPTFSEYVRASRIAGGEIVRCDAIAENNFAVPSEQIELALDSQSFRVVWICNPNNPTGQSISQQAILNWLTRFPQTVFVVDEAYIEFSTSTESLVNYATANLIVLRSMTKAYAMAGLRLGFAVVREPWHSVLQGRRIPWSVNALAQAAGIAALQDSKYYGAAMLRLAESKRLLVESLIEKGFRVIASDTGYFLMATADAGQLREDLLKHGLMIRDCTSFGLAGFVRIAVGTEDQNHRLVAVLTNQSVTLPIAPASRWDQLFRDQLRQLFQLRRDVRRFRTDPLGARTMRCLLESACMAPSVGLSQPWRYVSVTSPACRAAVIAEFEAENEHAALNYDEPTQAKYRLLKLSGLREAPEHLAVFIQNDPVAGRGLGRATMPESVAYSVVAAIQNLWLAARAEGIGVGWVSILRSEAISRVLNVSEEWQLVAYLCLGYPLDEQSDAPELEMLGWESRSDLADYWIER